MQRVFRPSGDLKAIPLRNFSMTPLRTREVVLPRFKLEQNYDLIDNLKEMGLTDLFQEKGDFSGMTSEKVSMNWVRLNPKIMILQRYNQTKSFYWSFSHLDTLSPAINNPYCFKIIHAFLSPSPAEAPGNHHCE